MIVTKVTAFLMIIIMKFELWVEVLVALLSVTVGFVKYLQLRGQVNKMH